jgi:hypothetical protein
MVRLRREQELRDEYARIQEEEQAELAKRQQDEAMVQLQAQNRALRERVSHLEEMLPGQVRQHADEQARREADDQPEWESSKNPQRRGQYYGEFGSNMHEASAHHRSTQAGYQAGPAYNGSHFKHRSRDSGYVDTSFTFPGHNGSPRTSRQGFD